MLHQNCIVSIISNTATTVNLQRMITGNAEQLGNKTYVVQHDSTAIS
jgi:hypothetical protein